ncbi:uncharacterized protein LOC111703510 [Eurytemora carolleeae]|uniref:uncharacterized protein LOC111703510 n=1 Tax=Eurytemora carolleeae TaxID=1294199 RepID=UPI000C7933C1|nr:uncharacterized protein LOC111703510 [Eurytemora carolleeae]|eukprot:XP_023331234.1 uncharacterized protein LOC111703510 [Eurytemora affinis]
MTLVYWIFLVIEAYHALAHCVVLFGLKLLPRKDLVSVRYYFLIDAACAAVAYSLHRNEYMLPFLIVQQWQHIFYFSTWDVSRAAKRVISWSSLDWDRGRWNQLDLVFGTAFDMSIHIANAVFIGMTLSRTGIVLAVSVVGILYALVIENPKFAWSSKNHMPDWVARRVKPLSPDQVQEIAVFEKLNGSTKKL